MRHGSPRRAGRKRERGRCGREPVPRLGDDGLRRGASGDLGPRPWDQGVRAQASSRGRRADSRSRERGNGRGLRRKDAADAETRHGLRARKSSRSRNPRSGSGPSVSARRRESKPSRERETPRTDRGGRGKPAISGSLRPKSLEGRGTPGGAIRSGRTGEDVATHTLRGRRSLRKPLHRLRAVRQADRRNTSRPYRRRGGSGNP
jgi:hypothetical protein